MNIHIKTLGFTPNEILTDFVHKKVGKLSRFYDRIISGEVSLCIENSDIKENKLCNIRLVIPGNDLLARAQCKTFEEAVDHTVDVLIKQIEKKKNKDMELQKSTII